MNAPRTSAALLLVGLVAGVVWWQWPAAKAPKRIPLTHRAAPTVPEETEAPPVLPPPTEPAELPNAPTVAAEQSPAAPTPGFDPQADLSTAVPDFLRLAQSGDFVTLLQTYAPPDPDMTDEQRIVRVQQMATMLQDPRMQQKRQTIISDMQFIQNSPPVISGNGDRAIYALPAGSAEKSVVFLKLNGRWYRKE